MDVKEKLVELLRHVGDNIMDFETENFIESLASYLITHGVTVQEWISTNDRLPEQFVDVLCYFPEKDCGSKAEIDYAETTDGHFVSSFKWGHPTHWIPLPQPPKGE